MLKVPKRRLSCVAIAALVGVSGVGSLSARGQPSADEAVPPPPQPPSGQIESAFEAAAARGSAQLDGVEEPSFAGGGGIPADQMLIPPGVEGAPYPSSYGGYCYVGPHPSDPRVTPGDTWDPTDGQHVRSYPPLDLRLFSYQDGCYYFIGDPHDFGYEGPAYSYYGAHPVLSTYGGGWCFMIGGHAHAWAPWSSQFAVVGPWYTWRGVYDPFFWTYWPYYSAYYRAYYPRYYSRGRFYTSGGYRTAPAFGRGYAGAVWTYPGVIQRLPSSSLATQRAFAPVGPARPPFVSAPASRGFAPSGSSRTAGGARGGRR